MTDPPKYRRGPIHDRVLIELVPLYVIVVVMMLVLWFVLVVVVPMVIEYEFFMVH